MSQINKHTGMLIYVQKVQNINNDFNYIHKQIFEMLLRVTLQRFKILSF
jgi:hypothetical protein